MAKRTSRRGIRGTKATSRKPAAAEVEILEDDGGASMEFGIVVATAVVLFIAILLIDKMQATISGDGIFF